MHGKFRGKREAPEGYIPSSLCVMHSGIGLGQASLPLDSLASEVGEARGPGIQTYVTA